MNMSTQKCIEQPRGNVRISFFLCMILPCKQSTLKVFLECQMFLDYDKSEPAVGIKVDRKAEVFPNQNFWLVLNSCGIKKLAKGSKRAARVMQPAPADENYVFFEQNAHDRFGQTTTIIIVWLRLTLNWKPLYYVISRSHDYTQCEK